MNKTYQYFVSMLLAVAFFSCSEETELPIVQFEQRAIVNATSASLLFDSQQDLSQFDEIGYLIGENEDLVFGEAERVMLDKSSGDSRHAFAEDLLPEQTYFFSFYTVVDGAIKVYEATSFTTYKKGSWVKRAIHPSQEDIGSGHYMFRTKQGFYIGGGTNRSDGYVDYLYRYDWSVDKWSKKANSPTEMRGSLVSSTKVSDNEAIILTSDIGGNGNPAYLYNSLTNKWTSTNAISDTLYFEPNLSSVLFTADKNAYLIGSGETKRKDYRDKYNMVYQYDSTSMSWVVLANYDNMEMYYPKAAVFNERIYFASRNIRNEIHNLDIGSGSIILKALRIPTDGTYINDMIRWKDGFVVIQDSSIFYYNPVENDWLELPQGDFGNIKRIFVEGDRLFLYDVSNSRFVEYLP